MTTLTLIKAHAYGNDFLLADADAVATSVDRVGLARRACDRHRGLGADGLIFYHLPDIARAGEPEPRPVRMALLNADGSYSEVSGNGVRCLAAWIAERRALEPGAVVRVQTDAGCKQLTLLQRSPDEMTFRAAMGQAEAIATTRLSVDGEEIEVVTLRVGNPQCVVLGPVTAERLHRVASRLAVHPHFPNGTNVELATVEGPDRVRILIWERGVGPTEASGTGACAAAVAAMRYGGADRDVNVISPGGAQRVEWCEDGLYLTGTAEIIGTCQWKL